MAAKTSKAKPAIPNLSTMMWLPAEPAKSKHEPRIVVVDDIIDTLDAGEAAPEGAVVYTTQEITLRYELTGKQRRELADIARRSDASKNSIAPFLQGAEQRTIFDASQLPEAAQRSPEDLQKLVETENDMLQQQHLQEQALNNPEAAKAIANMQEEGVYLQIERACVYWRLDYELMQAVADLPGAFTEDMEDGFIADWLRLTDELLAELGKLPKPIQKS